MNTPENNTEILPARVERNRKNAQASTGPRTKKGRQAVRWNALKHGLLAAEVVIPEGDVQEDPAEFRLLFSQLVRDLQPVGTLEEILVERIAVSYWRLRRALRAEAGELRLQQNGLLFRDVKERLEQAERDKNHAFMFGEGSELKGTSLGIDYLRQCLDKFIDQISARGELSEDSLLGLKKLFDEASPGAESLFTVYNLFHQWIEEKKQEEPPDLPGVKNFQEGLISLFKENRNKLAGLKKMKEGHEEEAVNAQSCLLSVPAAEASEKLLRYETAIEKQLYRALNELERLQRMRKGDQVLPPITVDLSSDK